VAAVTPGRSVETAPARPTVYWLSHSSNSSHLNTTGYQLSACLPGGGVPGMLVGVKSPRQARISSASRRARPLSAMTQHTAATTSATAAASTARAYQPALAPGLLRRPPVLLPWPGWPLRPPFSPGLLATRGEHHQAQRHGAQRDPTARCGTPRRTGPASCGQQPRRDRHQPRRWHCDMKTPCPCAPRSKPLSGLLTPPGV
jgi:hypothetical protein